MKQLAAGPPLVEFIKLCYQANLPPLLIGKHGVGKSELLEQAADELEVQYICRDLSLMEPPDLIGMPKLEGGVTRFFPPSFLPTGGKGILVFEELNRCPSYMRAPCLQLLTARCLNDYRLPPGWLPCAAINPNEDYEVQDLDPALLSRFVKLEVVPDRKLWLYWAERNSINEDVLRYVNSDSKIFKDTSPRDWVMASKVLKEVTSKTPKTVVQAALSGIVGRERATAWLAFLKGGPKIPSFAELLEDYKKNYQKQVVQWRDNGQVDILDNLVYSTKVHLQSIDQASEFTKDKKLVENFVQFMKDIPQDLKEDLEDFLEKRDIRILIAKKMP